MENFIEEAVLLKITMGESDRAGNLPLYEAIVLKARDAALAGATVTRGVMGFGSSHKIHSSKMLELASDLPFIVEIIDRAEKIDAFLLTLEPLLVHCVVIKQKVSAHFPIK
jgi:PII-like signaling protein